MEFSAWYLELRSWLIHHPEAILLGIFLIALIEAVAVIGVVVPAVPALFVLCVLAAHTDIPLMAVFAAGIAGAMLGDGISYTLGKGFKHQVHAVWPFSRYPDWLARSEAFVERHGGKSIIFGRFIGPLRAFVPMAAGIFRMRPLYFLWMNLLSALVWAPFHLLPGYSLGAAAARHWLPGRPQLILVGLILIVVAILAWLLPVLEAQRRRHAIRQPLENHGRHFCRGGLPEDQRAALRLGLAALAGFTLLTLLLPWLRGLDVWLTAQLFALRQDSLDPLLVAASLLGDPYGLSALGGVMAIWLALRRQWELLVLIVTTALLALVLPELLKALFTVPRPPWVVTPPASWAYPSGHAFSAVLVWGVVMVVLGRYGSPGLMGVARPALLSLMLFTIVSRPYLGVHWVSDVLGGALLGLAVLCGLRWAWYQRREPTLPLLELLAALLLALTLSFSQAVLPRLGAALPDYAQLLPALVDPVP